MALKVLHLITSMTRGGIEKWLLTMAQTIPRSEIEMDFCCKGPTLGELAPMAQALGAKFYHCPLHPTLVGYARELLEILKREKYDIVHNHLEAHSGLGAWVANNSGVPVITSFHNTQFPPGTTWTETMGIRQLRHAYSRISIQYALNNSHTITGCSMGVLRSLYKGAGPIPSAARALYYGIEIPALPSLEERIRFRAEFGWQPDTQILLHVGRFAPQKNHEGLLTIFERTLKVLPQTRLLIVGHGPLESQIQAEINARGLAKNTLILGARDDVARLMSLCDLFVFPSHHEGFGLVAIEANAAHLPVVGTNIPGLSEAIDEGKTGLLHDPKDTSGMATSVIRLLRDPDYRHVLGRNGRARARRSFSVQVGARRLMEVYDESLGLG